jgi:hypothetical protein
MMNKRVYFIGFRVNIIMQAFDITPQPTVEQVRATYEEQNRYMTEVYQAAQAQLGLFNMEKIVKVEDITQEQWQFLTDVATLPDPAEIIGSNPGWALYGHYGDSELIKLHGIFANKEEVQSRMTALITYWQSVGIYSIMQMLDHRFSVIRAGYIFTWPPDETHFNECADATPGTNSQLYLGALNGTLSRITNRMQLYKERVMRGIQRTMSMKLENGQRQ